MNFEDPNAQKPADRNVEQRMANGQNTEGKRKDETDLGLRARKAEELRVRVAQGYNATPNEEAELQWLEGQEKYEKADAIRVKLTQGVSPNPEDEDIVLLRWLAEEGMSAKSNEFYEAGKRNAYKRAEKLGVKIGSDFEANIEGKTSFIRGNLNGHSIYIEYYDGNRLVKATMDDGVDLDEIRARELWDKIYPGVAEFLNTLKGAEFWKEQMVNKRAELERWLYERDQARKQQARKDEDSNYADAALKDFGA